MENPGLKPIFKIEAFLAGLKSSSPPLLKQGAPTQSLLIIFQQPFGRSHSLLSMNPVGPKLMS
jgi:hypothetical protein